MCGIAGIVSKHPVAERNWLAQGTEAIHHRGPDDCGEEWSRDGRVGLAFRRLAIIDLSPSGHQPMSDARGELRIVFNGEIYNYVDLRNELSSKGHAFRSTSDTEVILAAYREWGVNCLERLNGMFAFALHDEVRGRVFLARDRAGEKPLFYSLADGTLRFGSELKVLMADPTWSRQVDSVALDCFLAMGFVPGDRCILAGARKLPPAHAMAFDLASGQLNVWRYWQLPELDPSAAEGRVDEVALLDEFDALFADSVRRQMAADVPVGILLSGGVDSSLVTAMAARTTSRVKTFTIRFAGHARYDETEHARLIARHFGTEHTELDAAEATVDLLPLLAQQYDEPLVDSSMIPTFLVSQLIRQHCTVALGGDGGDELFGGYFHYGRLLWLEQHAKRVPQAFRSAIAAMAGAALPIGFKGRNWLQAAGEDLNAGVPLIASYFDARTRGRLMANHTHWPLMAEGIRSARVPRTGDLLQRATRTDFENYLAEDILVKVDRASMLNSLEVRAPLLDYRIVEFAYRKVPSSLKATTTQRKVFPKRLASRLLPPEFDQSRKQGFAIPLASWLEGGLWQARFREILFDSGSTVFDHTVVEELFSGQAKGRSNSERLFALVQFELWRREYHISL